MRRQTCRRRAGGSCSWAACATRLPAVAAAHPEDLLEYFSGFGAVLNAYIIYDPTTKLTKSSLASRDFGYVEFEDVRIAELVLRLPNHQMKGKRISIETLKNAAMTGASKPPADAAGRLPTSLQKTARQDAVTLEAAEPDFALLRGSVEQGQLRGPATVQGMEPEDPQARLCLFETGQPLQASLGLQAVQSPSQALSSRSFGEFYSHIKSLRDNRQNRCRFEKQADLSNLRFACRPVFDQRGLKDSSPTVILLSFQPPY